ncbi:MAG: DMT family transporter [Bacteroidota bacterium]
MRSTSTSTSTPTARSWRWDALLLGVVTIWGINFPLLKGVLELMHPHVVNIFRFVISALVLGLLHARAQRETGASFFAPMRTHGRQIIALGLLGYLLYQFCFILGIDYTTSGNAALIMASAPLWTALIGQVQGADRLNTLGWCGLLLSLMGTACVILFGTREISLSSDVFRGNLIMLTAALFWALYTVLSKPVLKEVRPISLTFLSLLFMLPFLTALGIPYVQAVSWPDIGVWVWWALLYSGGLSIGVAVVLWNLAVQRIGPSQTAAYSNLVPLIALITGVLFLDEAVTAFQVAGGVILIGGLVLMRRAR